MTITLQYSSRRGEVWSWYRRSWRRTLWKFHQLVGLGAGYLAYAALYADKAPTPGRLAAAALLALVPIAALVLYPQLRFKPELRTLTADEGGLKTIIGKREATIPWTKIARVVEENGYVILENRNRNAFMVPPRAFESERVKAEFIRLAREARDSR